MPAAHAQTPGAHAPCAAISHCFSLEKSHRWPQRHRQAPLLATNSDEIAGQNEPSQGRFWPDKHHEARREDYRSQRPRALRSPAQGSLDNTASARRSSLSQTPQIAQSMESRWGGAVWGDARAWANLQVALASMRGHVPHIMVWDLHSGQLASCCCHALHCAGRRLQRCSRRPVDEGAAAGRTSCIARGPGSAVGLWQI